MSLLLILLKDLYQTENLYSFTPELVSYWNLHYSVMNNTDSSCCTINFLLQSRALVIKFLMTTPHNDFTPSWWGTVITNLLELAGNGSYPEAKQVSCSGTLNMLPAKKHVFIYIPCCKIARGAS